MLKVIAIDDEPLALRQISSYISQNPSLESVSTFDNGVEALEFMAQNQVDLIFVDIEMPEMTGVEFVKQLPYPTMVVFTTAYADYAIEGFKLNIIDYLLKPFSLADFSRTVAKANGLYELFGQRKEEQGEAAAKEVAFISVKLDHRNVRLDVSTIHYVIGDGEYVRIVLDDNTTMLSLTRLKNMESALPSTLFLRVHRSHIVNKTKIKSYVRWNVTMNNDYTIPVGESYREEFMREMEGC